MANKMIVQMGSFKGKQLIREPLKHNTRKGKTAKDRTTGTTARNKQNVTTWIDRLLELK